MSSLPGLTLESFVLWSYDLTADEEREANPSLRLASALGNIPARRHLTSEQFKTLVSFFEQDREYVERMLEEFDEDNQSWRDYAGAVFSATPGDEVMACGAAYIYALFNDMTKPKAS